MPVFSILARVAQSVGLFHPRPTPTFEELLDAAEPAEKQWSLDDYVFIGAELGYVCRVTGPADGLWLCHNGHENRLAHFKGEYPFKYLKCARCGHVVCEKCPTTEVLTHVARFPDHARIDGVRGEEVPYCSVCTCGLSRRAMMQGNRIVFAMDPCHCGRLPVKEDSKYFIGGVKSWRLDPAGRGVALRLERRQVGTWETLKPARSTRTEDTTPPRAYTAPAVWNAMPYLRNDYLRLHTADTVPGAIEQKKDRPRYRDSFDRHKTYWDPATARPLMGPRALTVANP